MNTVNSKYHILLVDDNEGDILLTKEAIDETQLISEVTIKRNGQEAIDYLSQFLGSHESACPDFIFLDINMPKVNGHEVLEWIKSTGKLRHIPVVILTTSQSENDVKLAYENHCNSYIQKPLRIKAFFEAIKAVLELWLVHSHTVTTKKVS